MSNFDDQAEILGNLSTLIGLGELLYADYLSNGKTKSRARLIRENCDRIKELLLINTHRLEPGLKQPALQLIHHTMCFVSQWDAYDAKHDIDEDQGFSYPTDIGFPKSDVEILLSHSN